MKKSDKINIIHLKTSDKEPYEYILPILKKDLGIVEVNFTDNPISNSLMFVSGSTMYYAPIDVNESKDQNREILDAQKRKLEEELDYFRGFLASVEKKLGNERFVQNAKPEVVDIEKKKKADAQAKIKAIEESLASL